MHTPSSPLAGIVVVELGGSLSAPFAGQALGDLGADVIKVERAQGDDSRKWGEPYVDGSSISFHFTNRNKRSVTLDLRNGADKQKLIDLIVDRADIVIQNLRPGQIEALGLGADDLRALKPSLIYCNMGAFGRAGPLRFSPGYDPLMQAFGGIMSVVGEGDRPPVRVGPSMIDVGTGMWAVIGTLAALNRRHSTGEGSVVDVSLLETAIGWMMGYVPRYYATGEIAQSMGSGQIGIAPYQAFPTLDGYLVVAAGNDKLFGSLCDVLGRREWLSDPRFATNSDRSNNREDLVALISEIMVREPSANWIERIETAGVPCAPVQNIKQLLEHEQTKALGMIHEVPGHATLVHSLLPLSFDGERRRPERGPPRIGEHTDEIFPQEA
jgi:crotonobetainyl-CoA:carnitine CoA-transferase CaiB-like acyl-CoA transferase